MKSSVVSGICILFLFFSISKEACAQSKAATVSPAELREKIAADITANLVKKDYKATRKDFAKIMLDALTEEKLKGTWEGLIAQIGDFQKVLTTKEEVVKDYNQIKKRCQFAQENASIIVTFNEENKVIGLFLKL